MNEETMTLRQTWLGSKPYVLIEVNGLDNDGDIKIDFKYGGALDADDAKELIVMLAEQIVEDGAVK